MPKATVPLGSTPSFSKPAGFGNSAGGGFGKADDEDDEEETRNNPIVMGACVLAVLVACWFCYQIFQTDQILGRALNEARFFGEPSIPGADVSSADDYASEDEPTPDEPEDTAADEEEEEE